MSDDTAAGMVYLIGAGPGAPDLLTLRALRALERSDLLLCDHILGEGFLAALPIDCSGKELIWMGKSNLGRQDDINRDMVAAARAGRVVARVKNGDPLVFGRGAEEADYLDHYGVRWEFVPGLSSSISTLTNAGYPVTNRGVGRAFAVVSARLAGGDFNQKLPVCESLVVLMGWKVLDAVRARLVAEGWSSDTPAVLIERGTGPFEKRVAAPLHDIVERGAELGIDSPVLLAVGTVAEHRYASPQRQRVLCLAADPLPWRGLGDVLHWPATSGSALLGGAPPEHDALLVTSAAEVAAWHAAQGQAGFAAASRLAADDAAAAALAELGVPATERVTATTHAPLFAPQHDSEAE